MAVCGCISSKSNWTGLFADCRNSSACAGVAAGNRQLQPHLRVGSALRKHFLQPLLKNVWKNTFFYTSLLKSVCILEFLWLLWVMFSFCGQEWSRNAENPTLVFCGCCCGTQKSWLFVHHGGFSGVLVCNCITYIWKCIQEETFQAKQMTLIRYQYVTKKLPWKHTHLVWIKGVGFRTGDIIQLDKLVKYWQEAERQQCLHWGEEHALAFLIEHSQDFHAHNGWLQEPQRSSPVQCPAWFIIPSVVKGRFAFPGNSHLVREQGGYLKAALTSRGYFLLWVTELHAGLHYWKFNDWKIDSGA